MAWQLYQGDCLEVLKQYPDSYFDSVVTDPPYELGFMGKKWDSTGIAYNVELWKECLRVLKPGGHLLAFGGTRTYHRMACAIEDAGFEIRDQIQWIYGSGFPKSYNLGKGIDKLKKTGNASWNGTGDSSNGALGYSKLQHEQGYRPNDYSGKHQTKTEITDPEAQLWDGWGTALKPANEPIVLARKPLSEKTIAENVLKWGTGGLNIDGCRIGTEVLYNNYCKPKQGYMSDSEGASGGAYSKEGTNVAHGRFPANVIFDEEAGKLLDEQSGILKSGALKPYQENHRNASSYKMNRYKTFIQPANEGGASRFFYCAKASKKERGDSKHPTVKPLSLMRYLCRLITPPEGIVLDPFAGSGTTLEAAILEGFNVVGIEKEHDYIPDIRRRIERAQLNTKALEMNLFQIQ